MSRQSRILIRAVVALSAVGAMNAETLPGTGEVSIPPPEEDAMESVEATPVAQLKGEAITLTWRLKVQHVVSTDSRRSSLILFQQYRVAEGADLFAQLDFAFFDEEGRLLHTWENSEYSVSNTEADDPDRFPTWIIFEASDEYGLALEDFDAIRSYKVVLRTTEN